MSPVVSSEHKSCRVETPEPILKDMTPNVCPQWIANKLGIPVNDVASLEITCSSRDVYGALLEYFAHTSVDARDTPLKLKDCGNAQKLPERLSAMWTGPGSGYTRRPDEPAVPTYHLGLGYARVHVNGKDVFVAHVALGDPFEVDKRSTLFRALVLFAASPETIKEVTQNALKWQEEQEKKNRMADSGKYVLLTLDVLRCGMVRWKNHGQKDARPLGSIFLKTGLQEAILVDMKSFLKSSTKAWYMNHGLPYRRNYLFHGPPGVGKTSLIRGLAGEFKLTGCFLCLGDENIGNRQLQKALSTIPKPAMVVLEDVDVLFNAHRKSATDSKLTFSGLLNALDGLVSTDGIIAIMTTNHVDRLDSALIRAGRVDRRFAFSTPEREQVKELFESFYPDAEKGMANRFAQMVFEREEKEARSIATLQQHFIYTRENTAQESIELLPKFFSEFYPKSLENLVENLYV